jgi:hypothetical protein
MERSVVSNDKQLMRKVEDRLARLSRLHSGAGEAARTKHEDTQGEGPPLLFCVSRFKYRSEPCGYTVMEALGALRTQDVYSGVVGDRYYEDPVSRTSERAVLLWVLDREETSEQAAP